MPETSIPFPAVRVCAWHDPVIDALGHDPRSLYAETFWLPTIGPTCLLLLRHLAQRFEERGGGEAFELPLAVTSHALGIGPRRGNDSPLLRSLSRLVEFDLAYIDSDGTVSVRRHLPPVKRRHARRLPSHLQAEHEAWLRRHETARRAASEAVHPSNAA